LGGKGRQKLRFIFARLLFIQADYVQSGEKQEEQQNKEDHSRVHQTIYQDILLPLSVKCDQLFHVLVPAVSPLRLR